MSFHASTICCHIYQIRADVIDNLEEYSYPDWMAFFLLNSDYVAHSLQNVLCYCCVGKKNPHHWPFVDFSFLFINPPPLIYV